MNDIPQALAKLPDAPGVYFFYAKNGELLYVGKAASLRSRVRSYFSGQKHFRPIEAMLHEVAGVRFQETDSALEAMIAEANAIKKYQPKYNVDGKDDKSWNYIVITKDEYPRIETIRQHELNDHQRSPRNATRCAQMFGPYPGMNTAATMKAIRKIFHFSSCKPNQRRPCFYYEIGQCLGVCTGEIPPKEYRARVIRPLSTFLSGRKKFLLKQLEVAMRKAAKAEDFEEAGRLRNQIHALQRIQDIALLNRSFVGDQTSDFRLRHQTEDRSPIAEVHRIEGYDISNLGPTGMVGSMVVFEHGSPKKSDYRKFRIRTVVGQSDVDCLEEVLRRRLKHSEWPYPQLFLIDGGLPQVNRAKTVLADVKLDIPIVGIAKGADRKKNEIILGTKDEKIIHWIYKNTRTLIAVRDEAHRFAVKYQRALRILT